MWVPIFSGNVIECPVVHTQVQGTIFFLDKQDEGGTGAGRISNKSLEQVLGDPFANFGNFEGGYYVPSAKTEKTSHGVPGVRRLGCMGRKLTNMTQL